MLQRVMSSVGDDDVNESTNSRVAPIKRGPGNVESEAV